MLPAELGARLDAIMACAERLVQVLPPPALEYRPPGSEGTVRDLAFHLFRLALAYVDGMDMGELRETWLGETAPPDLADGPAVARYGALVRGRVSGWFQGAGPGEYTRVIATPAGPVSGRHLLERTARDAAVGLCRLHAVAGHFGVTPPEPLPPDIIDAGNCA